MMLSQRLTTQGPQHETTGNTYLIYFPGKFHQSGHVSFFDGTHYYSFGSPCLNLEEVKKEEAYIWDNFTLGQIKSHVLSEEAKEYNNIYEIIPLPIRLSIMQAKQLREELVAAYQRSQYNLLTKNCVHFAEEAIIKCFQTIDKKPELNWNVRPAALVERVKELFHHRPIHETKLSPTKNNIADPSYKKTFATVGTGAIVGGVIGALFFGVGVVPGILLGGMAGATAGTSAKLLLENENFRKIMVGAVCGAAAGAAAGSFLPIIGTLIGGIIGFAVGTLVTGALLAYQDKKRHRRASLQPSLGPSEEKEIISPKPPTVSSTYQAGKTFQTQHLDRPILTSPVRSENKPLHTNLFTRSVSCSNIEKEEKRRLTRPRAYSAK